jgi:hypothetical protein
MELMHNVDETTKRNLQLRKQELENLAEKRASFKEILSDALHNSKEPEKREIAKTNVFTFSSLIEQPNSLKTDQND